jgi:copper chaperone CopZ
MAEKIRFVARGMHCGSCSGHVEAALRGLPGIVGVEVRRIAGTVTVEHDASVVSAQAMLDALAGAGFEASIEHATYDWRTGGIARAASNGSSSCGLGLPSDSCCGLDGP